MRTDVTEPAAHATTKTALTLLVVDDSEVMRTLIMRAARLSGLPITKIFEAGDGQAALTILEQHRVDALFTDINMPVMTGIELLKKMAGRERWRQVRRVVISTDGSESRRAEADALDVHSYINKPFRPEVMRDVLSDLTTTR